MKFTTRHTRFTLVTQYTRPFAFKSHEVHTLTRVLDGTESEKQIGNLVATDIRLLEYQGRISVVDIYTETITRRKIQL